MRNLATVLILLGSMTSAAAQERPAYPAPAAGHVVVHRAQEFQRYGTDRLTFDLYRPAGDQTVPVLIVANIGSRVYGTWPGYVALANAFADAGMAAVIYQASREKPLEHYDALITRLRERAADLRIDPTRIVLWAGSSNVSVALPLAMDASRDHIRGLIAYYGTGEVATIRTDLPVLFVRAGVDTPQLNERIDRLLTRALAANAPWTIESHGSGHHGFDAITDDELSREIVQRTIRFATSMVQPHLIQAYATASAEAAIAAAFSRGDWEAAIAGYRRRVSAAPGDAEAHRRLGLALMERQAHAEALTALERAWQLGRRGARDTGYPAARAAALAGNVERSLYWLETILSTPFGPPLNELRASADFATVRQAPAFEQLLGGIEEERRVSAMFDAGRSSEALRVLESAKEGRLAREATVNALAYALLNRGRGEDAIEVFRLNTRRKPESANAWDSLSEAFERAGRASDAVATARRALQLVDGDRTLSPEGRDAIRRAARDRLARLDSGRTIR